MGFFFLLSLSLHVFEIPLRKKSFQSQLTLIFIIFPRKLSINTTRNIFTCHKPNVAIKPFSLRVKYIVESAMQECACELFVFFFLLFFFHPAHTSSTKIDVPFRLSEFSFTQSEFFHHLSIFSILTCRTCFHSPSIKSIFLSHPSKSSINIKSVMLLK